ncbi:unnamed protein product [Thlaspi arvense]|uniref:Uncharacterized protein n=1 Tax=Thlaspi arvense TaxID=13288 RepID=A0AAU9RW99_THLAR|nr:unnamed protein product [Thlaspi arvense]
MHKLVARHSEGNYSSGRFELRLQSNGDLGFFTRNVLLDAINSPYLEIQSGGSGHQVKFNQSGLIYFNAINGSVLGFLSNKTSTSQFYQRAILEYDGVFRHYVYPKSANSTGGGQKNCTTISFVPPNKCTSVIQEMGAEACGFNSYCQIESDGRRQCLCPSGYIFFDPDDEMGGCKPKFLAQSCDTESQEADHFNFSEVVNLDWPWSDYEHYELVNEEWCKDVCLNDCFCAVAIFGNNNCWKKKNPLSNGRLDPSVDRHAFVKVRNDNSTFSTKLVGPKKKDQTLLVIGLSSLALLLFLLLLLNFLGFNWFRKRNLKVLPEYANKESKKDLGVFTYKELEEATNGFQEVIELLVENDAEAMNDMNGVEKFVMIALWCTQEDPSLKPTMKTVSLMLEGVLEAPVPPDPPSFVRSKRGRTMKPTLDPSDELVKCLVSISKRTEI